MTRTRPTPGSRKTAAPDYQIAAIFWLLATLIAFTPWFRAGATPLAGLVTQALSVLLLVLALWSPRTLTLSLLEKLFLGLLLLLPVVYLVPLPAAWVDSLPGRDTFAHGAELLDTAGPAEGWKTLSVVPGATLTSGLGLLLPVAAFLGARLLDPTRMLTLVKLLIGIAVAQGFLGLVQFGTAQTGDMLFQVPGGHTESATGSYANRNHLAGLMEMTLPLVLALFFYALHHAESPQGAKGWLRQKAAYLTSRSGGTTVIYGIIAVFLIISVLFTRSRTGITLSLLGVVIAAMMFARRPAEGSKLGPVLAVVALAAVGALAIGLAPVVERFSVAAVGEDTRWQLFDLTIQGGKAYLPVGTGPGTFPWAFPAWQPADLGHRFVNRAHNDYLEWFFDVGLLAVVLIAIALAVYVRQWKRLHNGRDASPIHLVQAAAGISLLLLAIHELVDYNLYTPMNQVVFGLLAAVFLTAERRGAADSHKKPRRRTPDLVVPTPAVERTQPGVRGQVANPFRESSD
jgi:O-antigen ligase